MAEWVALSVPTIYYVTNISSKDVVMGHECLHAA